MRIDDEVLAVLSNAKVDGNEVVLMGQLDRSLYARTNKALEAAGGKWNKKAKAHVFDADADTRIDQIILTGQVEVPKDEFNFFPSPPAVVARVLENARIQSGMVVLEPSAGKGAIAYPCAELGAVVDCYELMEANYAALAGDTKLGAVVRGDFLEAPVDPVYDRVVMNPPFLKQSDIKHVTHALKFLKPDGLLVAVMSAGVALRSDARTTDFRSLVDARGGSIEPLPENSFKASGTGVSTVLVTIPA